MMYGYGNSMMGGLGAGSMILLGLFWLLVFLGLALLVIWLIRQSSASHVVHPPVPPKDDACEIARTRYAKGEITKAEFEEMCRTLGV